MAPETTGRVSSAKDETRVRADADRRLLQPRDDAEAGCAKDLPSFGRGNGDPSNRRLSCAETEHARVPGACKISGNDLARAEVRVHLELDPAADDLQQRAENVVRSRLGIVFAEVDPSQPGAVLARISALGILLRHWAGERPLRGGRRYRRSSLAEENLGVLDTSALPLAALAGNLGRRRPSKRLTERESYEYALVSAAVALDLDRDLITRARIAVGSVAMKPWRLEAAERFLAGMSIRSPEMGKSVRAAFAEARPLPDSKYKVPLAQNAVLRAIEEAARS